MTPWRDPDEESVDLYPGLVVHDGRVSGSITTGRSRLPLWAFAGVAVTHGWDEVERGWSPSGYGWTAERFARFLSHLLEARGEFGRLLLVLADVERRDEERLYEALEPHGPIVNVTPGDPDAVQTPVPWWADRELSAPVIDQLRRCLAALDNGEDAERATSTQLTHIAAVQAREVERIWPTPEGQDPVLRQVAALTEEVGEIARAVLKRSHASRSASGAYKGLAVDEWTAELHLEIGQALGVLLGLAHQEGVDLDAAMADTIEALINRPSITALTGSSEEVDRG